MSLVRDASGRLHSETPLMAESLMEAWFKPTACGRRGGVAVPAQCGAKGRYFGAPEAGLILFHRSKCP